MPAKAKRSFDFLNFAYGTGAAIVIVGAMFKFLGWRGANEMFLVGLTTEAIIFLISGVEFKSPDTTPKWERVFPQLDPKYRGEIKQFDISEAQENYSRNTELLTNSVGDFNDTMRKLNEATAKLAESVERIGTGLERIDKTTSQYEEELSELKEKMSNLNTFYQQVNWVSGKQKEA